MVPATAILAWLKSALPGTQGFGTQFVLTGIIVLVLAALWFGFWLRLCVRRLVRAVREARGKLEAAGDKRSLPGKFDELDRELRGSKLLGPAWNRFSATLLLPLEPSEPVRQTSPAERFFDSSLLRRAGLSVRFHAALPNILVGGGLLLTFVGLILALRAAGAAVGSANEAKSIGALQALLSAASLKFMSSLFGLGLSIAYLVWHRDQLHRLDSALVAFCDAVTERMPPLSPLTLVRDGNRLLNEQLAVQQQFVQDIVLRLGDRLDTSLNQRLAEQIDPLRLAVEGMAKGMATMNQGALEQMIDRFGALLKETAGGQLRQLADTLAAMSSRLETLAAAFSEIQGELQHAGQSAAEGIGAAVGEISQRMTLTIDAWERQMATVNAALSDQTVAAQVAAATLLPSAKAIEGAASSIESASGSLPDLALALRDLAEALARASKEQSEVQAHAADLAQKLAEAASRFEGVDREIANTVSQLEAALQAFQSRIEKFVTAVDGGMARATGLLSGNIDELKEALEEFQGNLVQVDGNGSD